MLKEVFENLIENYCHDHQLRLKLWDEIEIAYTSESRYYHNLHHLVSVYHELKAVEDQIYDFDTILLHFYHDFVYDPLESDNELQSAIVARERLAKVGFPILLIERCYEQIVATHGHHRSVENDTNLFTDADLSVLGKDWSIYLEYGQQIRKEYHAYPDEVYRIGRSKVLKHFLAMERIYKTAHFYQLYEKNARKNMQNELELLMD